MANTVNDVMNVIASPDYGIKNIAGTTQEILAIMQGTHNSKNNIHAIVDDIRNLLQKLVDVSTEKKPIEISDKSPKINDKHIQNIVGETKNIVKSIDELSKSILKKDAKEPSAAIAKLSDKASQKVANAMIKNIEKQKAGGGLSAVVDAFNKLKDISIKELILGNLKIKKIANIFKNVQKDLNIKEKDLNSIITLINSAPEMIKSLNKIGWRVNRIIKNNIIEKLGIILVGENSILSLSRIIKKNEKTFIAANKITKDIKELVSSLTTIMKDLFFASLWSKLANNAIKNIENVFDKIIPFSNKLAKTKKDVDNGAKAAKNITILIGNLLITSIFLTITAVIGIPAILGAKVVGKIIDIIMPSIRELSNNNKHLSKAVASSVLFVAFSGIMSVASLALASVAVTGIPALIGSVFLLGIVAINVVTFKMLKSAQKNILIGSAMMGLMSISLLIYGIALGKITKATENVTWKQVGIIATTLIMLALATAVMGEPTTATFISLGSLTMTLLSAGLIVFGTALGKISKATENLKFKQVLLVAGSILALGLPVAGAGFLSVPITLGSIALSALSLALTPFLKTISNVSKATENLKMEQLDLVTSSMSKLGLAVAGMSILTVPITLGSVALGTMGSSLFVFVKTLKMINDMGNIPQKEVETVLIIMKTVGNFFKNNALKLKSLAVARMYQQIMIPLGKAITHLSKLNKIEGGIPTKLVYQSLNVMKSIGDYYIKNPISPLTILQADLYKMMMKPFGKTLKYFEKLKEMGSIPLKLVYQTLNAMKAIGNYYIDNPISPLAILQAKLYKKMMKPFGKTLNYFGKLKEMGSIPLKLVYQTLNAMKTIANYYSENPIEKNAIKQAKKYKKMMKPFGKTLEFFGKLKEMGSIPLKLVYQTLNTMKTIANYYSENPIEKKAIKQAKRYKRMMKPFGKTLEFFGKLKEMGSIPLKLVYQTLDAMKIIANHFSENTIEKKAIKQAKRYKKMMKPFGNALENLTKLKELGNIPIEIVKNATEAIKYISYLYNDIKISEDIDQKSVFSELIVNRFTNVAKNIQDKFNDLKPINFYTVGSIILSCRYIINFYTKTKFQTTKEQINIINKTIRQFANTSVYLKHGIMAFTQNDNKNIKLIIKSMKQIFKFLKNDTLNILQIRKARKNISILTNMATALSSLSNINQSSVSSIGDAISNALSGVNTVDLGQVQAVTNMFNAFNGINKSENIINKFAESVKEFTSTCKNLMDAMNYNTDAINNMDTSGMNGSIINNENNNIEVGGNNTNDNGGVHITNVDEIARTIAEKINGVLSVDIPDTQVQLLINGTGGNEWTISRY